MDGEKNYWTGSSYGYTVNELIVRLEHYRHSEGRSQIYRGSADIIQHLFPEAWRIFYSLDLKSLWRSEQVSRIWKEYIMNSQAYEKCIQKTLQTDPEVEAIARRRGWIKYFENRREDLKIPKSFFRNLGVSILKDLKGLRDNWESIGKHGIIELYPNGTLPGLRNNEPTRCYCLQFDDKRIISGWRSENSIRVWNSKTYKPLGGTSEHLNTVLCLQFDDEFVVTGTSGGAISVFNLETGNRIESRIHRDDVGKIMDLQFDNRHCVYGTSKGYVFIRQRVRHMFFDGFMNDVEPLFGHYASVNAIRMDQEFIISGSGDRKIIVWRRFRDDDGLLNRRYHDLFGHKRGVCCLAYLSPFCVSGSSDRTIKIWDVRLGVCIRTLEGHTDRVRCLHLDETRIISGSYDGTIRIWDFEAALTEPHKRDFQIQISLFREDSRIYDLKADKYRLMWATHSGKIGVFDCLEKTGREIFIPNIR